MFSGNRTGQAGIINVNCAGREDLNEWKRWTLKPSNHAAVRIGDFRNGPLDGAASQALT